MRRRSDGFAVAVVIGISGAVMTGNAPTLVAALAAPITGPSSETPSVERVLQTARSQIGTTESPAGSNRTTYGAAFKLNGQPWCAIFVWWAFDRGASGSSLPAKTASVYALRDAFQRAGRFSNDPQVGDVVIYGFGEGHTGIVESVAPSTITVIEGNTSASDSGNQSNGGAVARKVRSRNVSIVGYGHPSWPQPAPASVVPTDAACYRSHTDAEKELARSCWAPLMAKYGTWDQDKAFRIMWCESRGNPTARNNTPVKTRAGAQHAAGLFQVLDGPTDPEANVKLAAEMYAKRGWQPWECKG